ncbi:hypothetical protein PISMIDRAFT_115876, partial [Pisolithus microcarpus 441]
VSLALQDMKNEPIPSKLVHLHQRKLGIKAGRRQNPPHHTRGQGGTTKRAPRLKCGPLPKHHKGIHDQPKNQGTDPRQKKCTTAHKQANPPRNPGNRRRDSLTPALIPNFLWCKCTSLEGIGSFFMS